MSRVTLNTEPEIKGRGSSSFSMKNVRDRLAYLKEQPRTSETDREILYLQKILFKKR